MFCLKYGSLQSFHYVRFRWSFRLPLSLYQRGHASPIDITQIASALPLSAPALVVPLAVVAAGDPIPSTAYTADGRAGLRNPASPDPVWERGD